MADKNKLALNDEDFGPILEYVKDDLITDINYSNGSLWIDHVEKGRYHVENSGVTNIWIMQFVQKLSNKMNVQCNKSQPYLEAETDELRVSVIHEDVTNTGYAVSIRKTPPIRRITYENMMEEGYCDDMMETFLANSVKAHFNTIVCGLPGTGKTELVKYLTKYIPPYEKTITIEDNLEIRYSSINPGKDCVEMKVSDLMDYDTAIKLSMRQLPKWILIAETRSKEVVELLKSLSTGTNCLTTLHTDSVRKVPERIRNMNPQEVNINDVYMFVDIAVQVKSIVRENQKIKRYISEMALLYHNVDTGENKIIMLYDNGKFLNVELPADVKLKFKEAGITNPFQRDPMYFDDISRVPTENMQDNAEDTENGNQEITSVEDTNEINDDEIDKFTSLEHMGKEESAFKL